MPAFAKMLSTPLLKKGSDGAADVLRELDAYGLGKDDFDAVMELDSLVADPIASVPGPVKAALTRLYKQGHHGPKSVRVGKVVVGGAAPTETMYDDTGAAFGGEQAEAEALEENSSEDENDALIVQPKKAKGAAGAATKPARGGKAAAAAPAGAARGGRGGKKK